MNAYAFVAATPIGTARATSTVLRTLYAGRTRNFVATTRRAARITMGEKIPQGFTLFSEQLNGRVAMLGFVLAVVTEMITGQGIVGQISSIISNAENIIGM